MNRAKKGTTTALIIAIGTAIILMFPVLLFASTLTSLFTQDEEVLAFGVRFIRLMMPFYIAICFNQIYANALRYPFGWILCSVLLFIYYHKVGLHSKKQI